MTPGIKINHVIPSLLVNQTCRTTLKAGRSVGSEVDDSTNPKEPTVSEGVRSKWENSQSFYDVNGDGVIAQDDLEKSRTIFSQLHELTGEDKKRREEIFTQWWTEMILWNKTKITVKELVDLQIRSFLDDKENFVERMRNMTELLEHCLDVDNDNHISEKEETIFSKTIGLTDEMQDKAFFETLHPEENGLRVEALSNHWVTYFTEDDCSKAEKDDPVKLFSKSP